MSDQIAAITLTEPERALIAELATPEEFEAWQRKALAEFIERQAELKAQEQARALITTAVEQARAAFPSVFPVEEQPAEEAPPVDTPVAEVETP